MKKKHITTPIYYVNGSPHIGHAYTTIIADIFSRFFKINNFDTFFSVGTDEHGEKILEAAKNANIEPQKFVDQNSDLFKDAWGKLNIDYSIFLRTSDQIYQKKVQKALQILYDKGFIYKGVHEGLYCIGCEQYKTDKDLVDGLCPDHQKPPILKKEENYLFKLSYFAEDLASRIKSGELKILPKERKHDVLAFYKQGLQDISFSRKNIDWGVPLPWDETHVAYVWPDAFLNYLISTGWDGEEGQNPDYFPPDLQLMSKDIIRVHATIWPAMLLGLGLNLPKTMLVHGFFTVDGQKMSKSIGNVISPSELLERYGRDGTRYLLSSATNLGNDGDFGFDKFNVKYTADLANGVGNLVARVFTLAKNQCIEGKISLHDNKLKQAREDLIFAYEEKMSKYMLHETINELNEFVSTIDKFLSEKKPWENSRQGNKEVIETCLVCIKTIGVLFWPIIPEATSALLKYYNTEINDHSVAELKEKDGIIFRSNVADEKLRLFPRIS